MDDITHSRFELSEMNLGSTDRLLFGAFAQTAAKASAPAKSESPLRPLAPSKTGALRPVAPAPPYAVAPGPSTAACPGPSSTRC